MLKLLKTYWVEAAVVLTIIVLSLTLTLTKKDLAARNAEVSTLKAQLALKDEMIRQQNDAVDSLVAQRREDREVYLEGIKAANKQAVRLEVDAAKLLELPSPTNPADQCAAAEQLLRKELVQ